MPFCTESNRRDCFMQLAELTFGTQAQRRLGELDTDADAWTRVVIMSVACSGKISSDRTIIE